MRLAQVFANDGQKVRYLETMPHSCRFDLILPLVKMLLPTKYCNYTGPLFFFCACHSCFAMASWMRIKDNDLRF